ncbi:hypothetical protein [Alsobacter sp. SYSU BS001988]
MDEFETRAGAIVPVSRVEHGGARRVVLAATDPSEEVTSAVLLSAALARSIGAALLRAADAIDGVSGRG